MEWKRERKSSIKVKKSFIIISDYKRMWGFEEEIQAKHLIQSHKINNKKKTIKKKHSWSLKNIWHSP